MATNKVCANPFSQLCDH